MSERVKFNRLSDSQLIDCLPATDYFEEVIKWRKDVVRRLGELKWRSGNSLVSVHQLSEDELMAWFVRVADADKALRTAKFGPNRAPWDVERIAINEGLNELRTELLARGITPDAHPPRD